LTAMAAALAAMVVLALGTVAGAASTPAAAAAATSRSPVIYIFGDSMSDVGNNNYLLLSLAKCNYPWYGIDYKNGYPTGRFTNGRTIGDIMGKQ
jgi:phospholipase/lecithinase/hemolysin